MTDTTDSTATPEPAKPNPWSAAPDSEWCAEWAMIALSVGRMELGYQLARLARMAKRCEAEVKSAPPGPPIVPGADVQETATLTYDQPATGTAAAPPVAVPSGRCNVMFRGAECHGVAFYDGVAQRWTHMDTDLDGDHLPIVPPPLNSYDHQ